MQNNNSRQVPPYFAPPPPVQATPEIIQQTKKSSTLTKELEVVDLNSYASRKSAIGGALGISLFSSNTDQLVTLINNDTTWSTSQIVTLCLIVISLILQLFTFTIMAYLGGIGRVTNAKKKRVDRMNTTAMVLSMLTTLVNIAITSFSLKLNLNK